MILKIYIYKVIYYIIIKNIKYINKGSLILTLKFLIRKVFILIKLVWNWEKLVLYKSMIIILEVHFKMITLQYKDIINIYNKQG